MTAARARGRKYTSGRGRHRPPRARAASETRPEFRQSSRAGLRELTPESRKGGSMRSAEIEALAALGHGADQDSFLRAEVIPRIGLGQFLAVVAMDRDQVEDGRGE